MKGKTVFQHASVSYFLYAAVLAGLLITGGVLAAPAPKVSLAPADCSPLGSAGQIPAPLLIDFDDLGAGVSVGSVYQQSHGVRFEESRTAQVIAYDHPLPHSAPMTAMSQTDEDPVAVALNFAFDAAQAYVGMYLGNGGGATTARLEGYDADGNLICTANVSNVPDGHTAFIGFHDGAGRIVSVVLTYFSEQAESIDDLYFSAAAPPTATSTFTATPTASPTATRTATATATPDSTAGTIVTAPKWLETPVLDGQCHDRAYDQAGAVSLLAPDGDTGAEARLVHSGLDFYACFRAVPNGIGENVVVRVDTDHSRSQTLMSGGLSLQRGRRRERQRLPGDC